MILIRTGWNCSTRQCRGWLLNWTTPRLASSMHIRPDGLLCKKPICNCIHWIQYATTNSRPYLTNWLTFNQTSTLPSQRTEWQPWSKHSQSCVTCLAVICTKDKGQWILEWFQELCHLCISLLKMFDFPEGFQSFSSLLNTGGANWLTFQQTSTMPSHRTQWQPCSQHSSWIWVRNGGRAFEREGTWAHSSCLTLPKTPWDPLIHYPSLFVAESCLQTDISHFLFKTWKQEIQFWAFSSPHEAATLLALADSCQAPVWHFSSALQEFSSLFFCFLAQHVFQMAGQDEAEKTPSTRHTGCIQWLQVPLCALLKSLESIPAKYLDLSILFMCFLYSFQKSCIENFSQKHTHCPSVWWPTQRRRGVLPNQQRRVADRRSELTRLPCPWPTPAFCCDTSLLAVTSSSCTRHWSQCVVACLMKKWSAAQSATPRGGSKKRVDAPTLLQPCPWPCRHKHQLFAVTQKTSLLAVTPKCNQNSKVHFGQDPVFERWRGRGSGICNPIWKLCVALMPGHSSPGQMWWVPCGWHAWNGPSVFGHHILTPCILGQGHILGGPFRTPYTVYQRGHGAGMNPRPDFEETRPSF